MRYLNGTKDLGLQFKPCSNHQEVVAFTDANFSAKRSQTGAVVKLGLNVVACRLMKQRSIGKLSRERGTSACEHRSTGRLHQDAERIIVSSIAGNRIMKCDNAAAIVLATGEGSWRTKSAANKVYAVKEKWTVVDLRFRTSELRINVLIH